MSCRLVLSDRLILTRWDRTLNAARFAFNSIAAAVPFFADQHVARETAVSTTAGGRMLGLLARPSLPRATARAYAAAGGRRNGERHRILYAAFNTVDFWLVSDSTGRNSRFCYERPMQNSCW